jgi:hypothetical protein
MFGRKAKYIRELETQVKELSDPKILDLHCQNGEIDLSLQSPVARIMAWYFWRLLEGETTGQYAPNCAQVVASLGDPVHQKRMEITVRRAGGKTPLELKAEAEARLETAVQLLERCAGNLPNVRQSDNTDEFMEYLKKLHGQAEVFVDAYRAEHPAKTDARRAS